MTQVHCDSAVCSGPSSAALVCVPFWVLLLLDAQDSCLVVGKAGLPKHCWTLTMEMFNESYFKYKRLLKMFAFLFLLCFLLIHNLASESMIGGLAASSPWKAVQKWTFRPCSDLQHQNLHFLIWALVSSSAEWSFEKHCIWTAVVSKPGQASPITSSNCCQRAR